MEPKSGPLPLDFCFGYSTYRNAHSTSHWSNLYILRYWLTIQFIVMHSHSTLIGGPINVCVHVNEFSETLAMKYVSFILWYYFPWIKATFIDVGWCCLNSSNLLWSSFCSCLCNTYSSHCRGHCGTYYDLDQNVPHFVPRTPLGSSVVYYDLSSTRWYVQVAALFEFSTGTEHLNRNGVLCVSWWNK